MTLFQLEEKRLFLVLSTACIRNILFYLEQLPLKIHAVKTPEGRWKKLKIALFDKELLS